MSKPTKGTIAGCHRCPNALARLISTATRKRGLSTLKQYTLATFTLYWNTKCDLYSKLWSRPKRRVANVENTETNTKRRRRNDSLRGDNLRVKSFPEQCLSHTELHMTFLLTRLKTCHLKWKGRQDSNRRPPKDERVGGEAVPQKLTRSRHRCQYTRREKNRVGHKPPAESLDSHTYAD